MSDDTPSLEGVAGDSSVLSPVAHSGVSRPSKPLEIELPLPLAWIERDAAKVLRRLRLQGYRAYLVGGCVRDLLLGRYPKDFDIATSALPKEVKRTFSNCRLIGRRFRLAHIIFPQNTIEVATFRRDPFNAEDQDAALMPVPGQRPVEGRGPRSEDDPPTRPGPARERRHDPPRPNDVASHDTSTLEYPPEPEGKTLEPGENTTSCPMASPALEDVEKPEDLLIRYDNVFGTPQEDALRRDFTINGLFYDISTQTLIDWVGGLRDIESRVIRTIGAPEIRFKEDPIRMLRAIKFAASLRFTIEPTTWEALCRVVPDITRSAPPRVQEEILRMLRGGASEQCFRMMSQSGLLEHILPELAPLVAAGMRAEEEGASADTSSPLPAPACFPPGPEAGLGQEDSPASGHKAGGEENCLPCGSILAYLHALDTTAQNGLFLSNPVMLALLCLVPVFRKTRMEKDARLSDQVFHNAGELLNRMGVQLRLARRDRERARLILLGLAKILYRLERGSSTASLVRKSYFFESMLLFSMYCKTRGKDIDELRRLSRRLANNREARTFLEALDILFPSPSASGKALEKYPGASAARIARAADRPRRRSRRRRKRTREPQAES